MSPQHDDPQRRSRVHRWLSPAALFFVAAAALMGWGASFVGLHDYAQAPMRGFSWFTAWMVPGTFDGAAFGCTVMTYRASIHGRSALRGRMLMWAFTATSSWINWIHQPIVETKLVAAGLPVAAVAVFDVVVVELRADYEDHHGKQAFRLRPALLVLRWLVDRAGTTAAFRHQITSIPVEELAGLGHRAAPPEPVPAGATPAEPEPQHGGPPEPAPPLPQQTEPQRPAVSRKKSTLPPGMAAKVHDAYHRVAAEGRQLTIRDVQAVLNVPDALAADIVADYAPPSVAEAA